VAAFSEDRPRWGELLLGRTLAGRYRVERMLGAGGMGAVFEALHPQLQKRVAVKVLMPHLAEIEGFSQRFQQEARLAVTAGGQGVVQVLDLDSDPVCGPFLVMELLQGESLEQCRLRNRKMSVESSVYVMSQVLQTLSAVHSKGIIHRDLKPDNLFLTPDPRLGWLVKILDFGLARFAHSSRNSGLTRPGAVLGTPRYMAPEQAAGEHSLDQRVDIYACGAVLYACLAGEPPYAEVSGEDVMVAVLSGPPRSLAEHKLGLAPEWEQLVSKAMAYHPDKRFASAHEMLAALEHVSDCSPTQEQGAPHRSFLPPKQPSTPGSEENTQPPSSSMVFERTQLVSEQESGPPSSDGEMLGFGVPDVPDELEGDEGEQEKLALWEQSETGVDVDAETMAPSTEPSVVVVEGEIRERDRYGSHGGPLVFDLLPDSQPASVKGKAGWKTYASVAVGTSMLTLAAVAVVYVSTNHRYSEQQQAGKHAPIVQPTVLGAGTTPPEKETHPTDREAENPQGKPKVAAHVLPTASGSGMWSTMPARPVSSTSSPTKPKR
jgi:serine/threonine protein kinase